MEEVQEERLEDILAMMAEHQGRAALLAGDPVEMAAAQARAQRAIGVALGDLVGDHRIGVLLLDAMGNAEAVEMGGDHPLRKSRLALVEIAGEQVDGQKAAPFEIQQQRQKADIKRMDAVAKAKAKARPKVDA